MEKPGLYIVPTPIGNLKDITLRALETLQAVDLIACEDTRHSIKLLNHFGIRKPLMACEKFNEAAASERISGLIAEGKRVALISDAGTPGISDPGARLVSKLLKSGVHIEALPGPCAFVTALSASSFDGTVRFVGFFPRKAGEAASLIDEMKKARDIIIFYEAPRRIARTIRLLAESLPDRQACLARELSKLHEEYRRGTLTELAATFSEQEALGEWVCLIDQADSQPVAINHDEIASKARKLLNSGCTRKDALAILMSETGLSRNEIYKLLTELN